MDGWFWSLDGHHVLYSPFYSTASLPMMLGPKAQAFSYLVPTKSLFLPYSQTLSSEIPFFFFLLKTSPCAFSPFKHCPDVGGIVVSIAALQAVDPGSIPGRRSHFVYSANIYEQFSFNFGLPLLNVTRLCDSLLPHWTHEHKKGWLENAIFFSELFHHFRNPAAAMRLIQLFLKCFMND